MAFLIADLEALVQHLGLQRVVLIAQSMGGRAALGFATRHQDRILALVMADSWGSFDWPEQWDRAKMFAIPEGHPRAVARNFPQEWPELYYLLRSIGSLNPPRPQLEGLTPGGPTVKEVQRLQLPVLCIVGADDVIFPPSQIRAFAELLPDSEFVEVDGAGHSVYFERANAFNELVLRFLKKHIAELSSQTERTAAQ